MLALGPILDYIVYSESSSEERGGKWVTFLSLRNFCPTCALSTIGCRARVYFMTTSVAGHQI